MPILCGPHTVARGDIDVRGRETGHAYRFTGLPAAFFNALAGRSSARVAWHGIAGRRVRGGEARACEHRDYWDEVHRRLKLDAQSCGRSMQFSPLFGEPQEWNDIVERSLDDYRSGRSLMDHLGADRLIDPALTGMLLAIRRGLIEELNASSMSDYVLIDMAVIAFANAMRVQSMVGNTALIIEGEMFGQPTLRTRWKKEYGWRPEDVRGLAVEEHVARLRDTLLPLAERFHRLGNDALDGLRRQRQMPSLQVERSVPMEIRLVLSARDEDAKIMTAPGANHTALPRQLHRSRHCFPIEMPCLKPEPAFHNNGGHKRSR
jgi:hypothetical protein